MADNHKAKAEALVTRAGYARGGATKHGKHTTVNVVVASPPAGGAMPPRPMMPPPGGAPPMMPPHPPMAPPGAPMGGPPMGGPPPGAGGPPMPMRANGGRIKREEGGATPYQPKKLDPEYSPKTLSDSAVAKKAEAEYQPKKLEERAKGGAVSAYSTGHKATMPKSPVDAMKAAGYKTGGKIDDGAGSGEGRLEKIKAYGGKK